MITMALSTSIPRARVRLKRTTMLRVTPIKYRMVKESSMEKGIARLTRMALRIPMAKKITRTTRTRPERILFSRSATVFLISFALSITLVISVPNGQDNLLCSMSLSTSSVMAIIFSPDRFLTAIFTASRPSRRALLVSSLKLSTTRATSFR